MSLEALKRNGHNLQLGDFEPAGKYCIPQLSPTHGADELTWIPFNCAFTDPSRSEKGVHFYIDDYLFERVWKDPSRYAQLLSQYKAVMSPDFSLFTDYPPAVQIYNHWRKHLLAASWQRQGITVVPSICWSDEGSFDWCFDGEPVGGVISVSSVGTQKNQKARRLFLLGYQEMLMRESRGKLWEDEAEQATEAQPAILDGTLCCRAFGLFLILGMPITGTNRTASILTAGDNF